MRGLNFLGVHLKGITSIWDPPNPSWWSLERRLLRQRLDLVGDSQGVVGKGMKLEGWKRFRDKLLVIEKTVGWKLLWGQGTSTPHDVGFSLGWSVLNGNFPNGSPTLHVGVMAPVLGRHCQAQTTAQRRATSANPEARRPGELPT